MSEIYQKPLELLDALGLNSQEAKDLALAEGVEGLLVRVATDERLVADLGVEATHESLTLGYPSYILALAMGAGKTVLIGSIVASEFAMAFEYPDGPFIKNALVFAPGKTILQSLRQLASVPYERILPPRLARLFDSRTKLIFTSDKERDIPVIRGSEFNVVVTNTEKIRIKKDTIRKGDVGRLTVYADEGEAKSEVANLRLQAIASLPHLGVFSDEAHHTYGKSMDAELKKVRKTVDYLAAQTNIVAVVNTTGTPYYKKQSLPDVVCWYGLAAGISDNYLKELSGNVVAVDYHGDAEAYIQYVLTDFLARYEHVRLPGGASAKMAIYFPKTDDLVELRPVVDRVLLERGLDPTAVLVNVSDSALTTMADVDSFNRLGDPASPYRVILLVDKGTEGWDCPSLFACALARKLRSSNNFVLQAATRCLRQVPGNTMPARVYLSSDNFDTLDRQLQETFGESIQQLSAAGKRQVRIRARVRKTDLPPLAVTTKVKRVRLRSSQQGEVTLQVPHVTAPAEVTAVGYELGRSLVSGGVLHTGTDQGTVTVTQVPIGLYQTAHELASRFRADRWALLGQLRGLYPEGFVPREHLSALALQVEQQVSDYEMYEETVTRTVALLRLEGFEAGESGGTTLYETEMVYAADRETLLTQYDEFSALAGEFGFHCDPYLFDSQPEKSFFLQVLERLQVDPGLIEDVLFTGGITTPDKTEFFVDYRDSKGKWRRYTPDFLIRARNKSGDSRVLIVEIKAASEREDLVDGEGGRKATAAREWVDLSAGSVGYEMVFVTGSAVPRDEVERIMTLLDGARG